tara:strand:- start:370 stop:588 length:219 start_codon:yes stop_codon:yes gene_type:complete
MNKHCIRWADEIIKEMDGTFSAKTIKDKLIEKHGTKYVVNTISIGQYLTRTCIIIGKRHDRLVYKRRVKPNE